MDEETMDLIAKVRAEETANEREQVEQVFGLTGGELMDVAWVPARIIGSIDGSPFTFTYWYTGVPDYTGHDLDPTGYTYTHRTVCEDETFGQVPETVTDDEGTWKVVARYSTSGEVECPHAAESDRPVYMGPFPCPLCEHDETPDAEGNRHGYIYIGDGWAEIVYRLEEIQRATPADAGCWVDGHWGQYAIAHMVEKASGWGYADAEVIDIATRHLASIGPSEAPEITDDEHQALSDASDEVEAWLNDHVAPEGFYFGWCDGEFFLWSEETWGED